jgi:hypothetical protein
MMLVLPLMACATAPNPSYLFEPDLGLTAEEAALSRVVYTFIALKDAGKLPDLGPGLKGTRLVSMGIDRSRAECDTALTSDMVDDLRECEAPYLVYIARDDETTPWREVRRFQFLFCDGDEPVLISSYRKDGDGWARIE